METNLNVYQWLVRFYQANPIPRNSGNWDEVSGEAFLRRLLAMPIEEARYQTVCVCVCVCLLFVVLCFLLDWGGMPQGRRRRRGLF
jgi:hypothetical protein